jgi:hypothetical protein
VGQYQAYALWKSQRERQKRGQRLSEEMMAKNSPNLGKKKIQMVPKIRWFNFKTLNFITA